jgi:hypothetical protein
MITRRPILCFSLGICAFISTALPASAWDKNSRTVRLPGQKVVIQTGEPSVTTRGIASRGAVTLGTLYMPLNLPLTGVGGVGDSRGIADDSLTKAIEAEQHNMRAASAKAAFKAEIEYKLSILKRLSSPGSEVTSDDEAISKSIQQINNRLEVLEKQLTAIEHLLIIHDNYLQEKVKKEPLPMTAPK